MIFRQATGLFTFQKQGWRKAGKNSESNGKADWRVGENVAHEF
jgi:hypothetical protein